MIDQITVRYAEETNTTLLSVTMNGKWFGVPIPHYADNNHISDCLRKLSDMIRSNKTEADA